jgi:hypothetical protein
MRYLAILMMLPFLAASQTKIQSQIKEVTVFTLGAEVSRTARVNLTRGINELAFEKLSPGLDEKSIQFNAGGDITILSIKYDVRYDESTQARIDKAAALNKQLKNYGNEVDNRRDLLAVSVNEEQVLLANTDFDIWEGMNVTQLQQGVDLVRNRLIEIKQRKQKLRNEIDDLNQLRQKVVNQLQEMRIEDAKPNGVVLVKLKSESTKAVDAQISYVVADAGWEPYYDLRVQNVSEPLRIEYKAKVHQNTGEEWKGVKLTLSTGNPYEEGNLPLLDPWFLNFISSGYYNQQKPKYNPKTPGRSGTFNGVVVDEKTGEGIPFANVVAKDHNGGIVGGVSSDIDGRFRVNINSPATSIEVSVLGYSSFKLSAINPGNFYTIKLQQAANELSEVVVTYEQPLIEKTRSSKTFAAEDIKQLAVRGVGGVNARAAGVTHSGSTFGNERYNQSTGTSSNQFKISQNAVNLKFEVNELYDIPSDGENYKVAINNHEKEVDYLYQAVPKLNEHAFLTADITDWEALNLMNGYAGIYLEGIYLGETFINVEQASDTLQISLGKDENIVVQRKGIQQKEASRLFSGKKEQQFHYEIKVRNNKSAALKLQIEDQFPVSGNEDITVNRVESSGGQVSDKSGLITWEFILQPKEEKKIDLKYSIRYPRDKIVNLR